MYLAANRKATWNCHNEQIYWKSCPKRGPPYSNQDSHKSSHNPKTKYKTQSICLSTSDIFVLKVVRGAAPKRNFDMGHQFLKPNLCRAWSLATPNCCASPGSNWISSKKRVCFQISKCKWKEIGFHIWQMSPVLFCWPNHLVSSLSLGRHGSALSPFWDLLKQFIRGR